MYLVGLIYYKNRTKSVIFTDENQIDIITISPMISINKVIEVFCIADDFRKEFDADLAKYSLKAQDGGKHRARKGRMSDAEIMTILLCFHFNTFCNFKHYYLFFVRKHLSQEFPDSLAYNRFVKIESKTTIPLALFLQLFCLGECTGISFVDSTYILVCHNKRIHSNKLKFLK